MEKTVFGRLPDGREVHLYTLDNGILRVRVLDYGCRVQAIFFNGTDFVCGFDTFDGYLADGSSQGAFVGRVANRIKGARFTLNGKTYQLTPNEKKNHLHGVFGQTLFEVREQTDDSITFFHHSPAAEEGYPGDLSVTVCYRLCGDALTLHYTATSTEDTPINLTNHSYFNMGGIGSGSVLSHEMQMNADRITLVDDELIPTGAHQAVAGTAYDFACFQPIGARFGCGLDGYDTNFFLTKKDPADFDGRTLFRAASVQSDLYRLDCYTDLPCIQIYTGNFLGNGPTFKYGVRPEKQHAICLETQFEPDAVNHGEGILRRGETYDHMTAYRFSRR